MLRSANNKRNGRSLRNNKKKNKKNPYNFCLDLKDNNFLCLEYRFFQKFKHLFTLSCYYILNNKYNINIFNYNYMHKESIDTNYEFDKHYVCDISTFFEGLISDINYYLDKDTNKKNENIAKIKFRKIDNLNCDKIFFIRKTDELKEIINNIFSECQKLYFKLINLKTKILYKTSKIYDYDEDLRSNKLNTIKKEQLFEIIENKTIYIFRVTDLVNIIENSLSSCEYELIHKPIFPKNPFTNLNLSLSNLYNLYFKVKYSYLKMPILFHNFFLCHLNLRKFEVSCDVLIREQAIVHFLKNLNQQQYHCNIMKMLKFVKRTIKTDNKQIIKICSNINKEFPADILVESLKPYYHLFVKFRNTLNNYKSEIYKDLFIKHIRAFYEHNKIFGRKIITSNPKGYYFTTDYLKFNNYEPDTIQQSNITTNPPSLISRSENEFDRFNVYNNEYQLVTIALPDMPFNRYVRNMTTDSERVNFENIFTNLTYTEEFQRLPHEEARNRINDIIDRYNASNNENVIDSSIESSDSVHYIESSDSDDEINIILNNDDNETIIDESVEDEDEHDRDLYYDSDGFTG
jgi:hypothetical protein